MLLGTGRDLVKVLDFGIAKSLTPRVGATTMTNAGALLGSPSYMPPELVTGQGCDGRADLYSLGCVLYQCLAGELPFVADTVHELIALIASEPPKRLRNVPAGLALVIERLLAKDPARRYQTGVEARDALEHALDGGGQVMEQADPTIVSAPVSSTVLGWTGATAASENIPARVQVLPDTAEVPPQPRPPDTAKVPPLPRPSEVARPVKPERMSTEEVALVATSQTMIATEQIDRAGPIVRKRS